jgi:hypothetical protein
MRVNKIMRLLKEAVEQKPNLYSEEELEYMRSQLKVIEEQVKLAKRMDYRGFGK